MIDRRFSLFLLILTGLADAAWTEEISVARGTRLAANVAVDTQAASNQHQHDAVSRIAPTAPPAVAAAPAQPQTETLEHAWARALAVDQQLQARQYEVGSAQELVSLARAERRPVLAFDGTYTVRDNETAFVFRGNGLTLPINVFPDTQKEDFAFQAIVDVPLYTSGRIRHRIASAEARLTSTEFEVKSYRGDLLLQVAQEYIAVLRAERDLEVARSNVRSLTAHLRDVAMLHQHQRVPRSDLLAAEVARSNAVQREIQILHQLDAARAAYNRRLGRPLTAEFRLAALALPSVPADLEELMSQATAQRPELASLAAEVQALQEQGAGLLAGNRPQLGVHGGYAFQENRFRTPEGIASVGVGVNWNLWDGGKNRHKANALLQQAESLRRVRADLESRIRLEVRNAWLSIQEAQRRIEVTREAVQHAEENLRVNRKRYEFGTGTNTEVLDAVILRAETDRNHYNATYDAVLAVLRLRRAVGDL